MEITVTAVREDGGFLYFDLPPLVADDGCAVETIQQSAPTIGIGARQAWYEANAGVTLTPREAVDVIIRETARRLFPTSLPLAGDADDADVRGGLNPDVTVAFAADAETTLASYLAANADAIAFAYAERSAV